jgi:hypothetical protein
VLCPEIKTNSKALNAGMVSNALKIAMRLINLSLVISILQVFGTIVTIGNPLRIPSIRYA